jgi:hypothetical protein
MLYVNDRISALVRAIITCRKSQTLQERVLAVAKGTETLDIRDFSRDLRLAFAEFRTSLALNNEETAKGRKARIEAMTDQQARTVLEKFYVLASEVNQRCGLKQAKKGKNC